MLMVQAIFIELCPTKTVLSNVTSENRANEPALPGLQPEYTVGRSRTFPLFLFSSSIYWVIT